MSAANTASVEEAKQELSSLAPATHIHVSDFRDSTEVSAHAPSGDGASGPLGHLGACIGYKTLKKEGRNGR